MKYIELALNSNKVQYVHDAPPTLPASITVIETEEDIEVGMYYIDGSFQEAPDNEYYYWEDGAWVLNTTAAEVAVRAERNSRLTNTDSMALPDHPSYSAALLTYRKALRDIPEQEGFPWTGPDDPECPWPTLDV